jgi:hypothetical protein
MCPLFMSISSSCGTVYTALIRGWAKTAAAAIVINIDRSFFIVFDKHDRRFISGAKPAGKRRYRC